MKLERRPIVFARERGSDPVGHPAVILCGPDIMADGRQLRFNALFGTKRPPAARGLPYQLVLDEADGRGFPALLNCAGVFVVRKSAILRVAGVVSHLRRPEMARRARSSLGVW